MKNILFLFLFCVGVHISAQDSLVAKVLADFNNRPKFISPEEAEIMMSHPGQKIWVVTGSYTGRSSILYPFYGELLDHTEKREYYYQGGWQSGEVTVQSARSDLIVISILSMLFPVLAVFAIYFSGMGIFYHMLKKESTGSPTAVELRHELADIKTKVGKFWWVSCLARPFITRDSTAVLLVIVLVFYMLTSFMSYIHPLVTLSLIFFSSIVCALWWYFPIVKLIHDRNFDKVSWWKTAGDV